MAPAASRNVLRNIDLSQIPPPAKKKPTPRPTKSVPTRARKTARQGDKSQQQVPVDARLTEKGRAWAEEVAKSKAARDRRQKKADDENKLRERAEKQGAQEDNGSEDEPDWQGLASSDTDDDEPEDAASLLQPEFIIKTTTSGSNATQSRTQRAVASSPGPSDRRHDKNRGQPSSESSPGPRAGQDNASSRNRHVRDDERSESSDENLNAAESTGRKRPREETITENETSSPQDDHDSDAPSETEMRMDEVPSKKQRANGGGGRAKAHDYDGLTHLVIKAAQNEFQVRICTVHAFPGDEDAEAWAEECWENACEHREHAEKLSVRKKKLILTRTSTIRGRVKDKVVTKLVSHYGFKPGSKPANIEHNKQLAARLLKDDGYVYEDLEAYKGVYDHPILQDVINDQWFYGKKAEGLVFDASFNPIPDQVLALVFTAVDYAVRRWASGQLVIGTTFNEAAFVDTYERHLAGIEAWRHFSDKAAKGLARQKQRLYNHGRAHAGLPVLRDEERPRFNMDHFARAEQAMADDSEDD